MGQNRAHVVVMGRLGTNRTPSGGGWGTLQWDGEVYVGSQRTPGGRGTPSMRGRGNPQPPIWGKWGLRITQNCWYGGRLGNPGMREEGMKGTQKPSQEKDWETPIVAEGAMGAPQSPSQGGGIT